MKAAAGITRTHNPFGEVRWASCLRENLTSSSYGEGLETGRATTQVPRQSLTRQSTMSAFDRLTGVKHLRVRGMVAVRFAVILKAVGVNLFRATAFRKAETKRPGGGNGGRNDTGMAAGRLHAAFTMLLTILICFLRGKTESDPWIGCFPKYQAA